MLFEFVTKNKQKRRKKNWILACNGIFQKGDCTTMVRLINYIEGSVRLISGL